MRDRQKGGRRGENDDKKLPYRHRRVQDAGRVNGGLATRHALLGGAQGHGVIAPPSLVVNVQVVGWFGSPRRGRGRRNRYGCTAALASNLAAVLGKEGMAAAQTDEGEETEQMMARQHGSMTRDRSTPSFRQSTPGEMSCAPIATPAPV